MGELIYYFNHECNCKFLKCRDEAGHTPLCTLTTSYYFVGDNFGTPAVIKLLIDAGANEVNPLNVEVIIANT